MNLGTIIYGLKIGGIFFVGPHDKVYSTLGSILGSPHFFGRVPYNRGYHKDPFPYSPRSTGKLRVIIDGERWKFG